MTRITAYKINKYFRDHKTLLEIFALVNHNLGTSSAGKARHKEKIQKFRIQFLQGQVNMMEIVEEYSIIIYNIYIIYNNTTFLSLVYGSPKN